MPIDTLPRRGVLGQLAEIGTRADSGLGGGLGRLDLGSGMLTTPEPTDSIWIRIKGVNPSNLGGDVGQAAYAWEFVSRGNLSLATSIEKIGLTTAYPAFEMNDFSNVPTGTIVRAWFGPDNLRPSLEFVYDQSDCCVGGGGVGGGACLPFTPPKQLPTCIRVTFLSYYGGYYTFFLTGGLLSNGSIGYGGSYGAISYSFSITPAGVLTVSTSFDCGDPNFSPYSSSCTGCGVWDGLSQPAFTGGSNCNTVDSFGGGTTSHCFPPQLVEFTPLFGSQCPAGTGTGGTGGTGGGITGGGGVGCIPCNPAVDFPCYNCQNGLFCSNAAACFGGTGGVLSPSGGGGSSGAGLKSAGILGGPLGGSLGSPSGGGSISSGGGGCGCAGGADCGCGGNAVANAMPAALASSRFGSAFGGGLDGTRPMTIDAENVTISGTVGNVVVVAADGTLTTGSVPTTGLVTTIIKASDTARASTTTPTSDPALQFSMDANKTYSIRIKAFFDCGAAAGADGFKYTLSGPASPTLVRVQRRDDSPGALTPTDYATDTSYPTQGLTASATNGGWVEIDLIVQNGANAGTFAFQWSQNSSNVANTTVRAGSRLEYIAA